ncbi:MAG: hypothetical protein EOL97_07185 [Spirochaetia bacterium]|nr:hypothetical protein [Spirochaetia bacterium]
MIRQCYISSSLEEELKEWYKFFNELSLKETNYPIKPGNPTASEICASILSIVRKSLENFDFNFLERSQYDKKLNIDGTLKAHINIDVSLDKMKGIKKNDIELS